MLTTKRKKGAVQAGAAESAGAALNTPAIQEVDVARFMDTNEAALILGYKPRKIRKLCSTGTLPSVRIGDDYRIDRAAFRAFLERSRVKPQQ